MTDDTQAQADDLWPVPFPDRELHADPCGGCGHQYGLHAQEIGCLHGWTYDADGHALTEGCDCPAVLASQFRPPKETDL